MALGRTPLGLLKSVRPREVSLFMYISIKTLFEFKMKVCFLDNSKLCIWSWQNWITNCSASAHEIFLVAPPIFDICYLNWIYPKFQHCKPKASTTLQLLRSYRIHLSSCRWNACRMQQIIIWTRVTLIGITVNNVLSGRKSDYYSRNEIYQSVEIA